MPIRFCLARRTPNGTATTGITYTENALTDLTIETEDDDIKRLTGWNARDYLNIWIVREICSFNNNCAIAAYAYHPLFHGSGVDGVVIEARWLTEAATISPLAHEVGHYFGLYHTFEGGCLNDDCLRQGDYVCDTPPDRSTAGIPCDQNANTCDTDVNSGFAWDHPDPTRNHMDYGPFACMHDFTVGQADRMVFFLKNDRRSLLLSKGCQQPCPTAPVVAAFAPVDTVVAVGTTLTFFNKSQNAAQYAWTLNGTVPLGNQLNANYTFNKTGVYAVALTALPSDTLLCVSAKATARIRVVCGLKAFFTVNPASVKVGASVSVTSNTGPGIQEIWLLNGQQVAGLPGALRFTAPGLQVLQLTVSNGFCRDSQTLAIAVQDSTVGSCAVPV